jgi:tetratricopeptide (TPR) repeat protein
MWPRLLRSGTPLFSAIMALFVVASLVATGGCGSGRKAPLTMADRLRRAYDQPSADGRVRELAKVARLQLQSLDRTGAAKTVSAARQIYLDLKKPPVARPRPEPAAAEPAADPVPAADEGAAAEAAADEGAAADEQPADVAADGPEADQPPDQSADEIEAVDMPREEINPVIWGPLLLEIAAVFADLGEQGPARDVLADAVALANEIPDEISRATLLAGIGGVYGSRTSGDAARARTNLEAAETLADSVEPRFRAEALASVALGYVKAGLATKAGAMVEKLETSARDVESPRARAEGLAAAANVRALSGDPDAAKELLGEAAEAAKSIEGSENRCYALMSVATAMSAAGDHKGALSLLAEAEKSANRVPDPEAQRTALERVRGLKSDIGRRK